MPSIHKGYPLIGYYLDGNGNVVGKYVGGEEIDGSPLVALQVTAVSTSGSAITSRNPSADSIAEDTPLAQDSACYPYLFDPVDAQWDRQRGNHSGTLLASAGRTVTTQSSLMTNYNAKGIHVIIDVTSIVGGACDITPTIQGYDPLSGKYYDLLIGLAIVDTGYTILKVYPGIGEIANAAASDILPRDWRIKITHGNANTITYSVGYQSVI